MAPALCYYYDDDCYFKERKGAEGAEQESQADNMLSSEPNPGLGPTVLRSHDLSQNQEFFLGGTWVA